jgi:protein-S-isoprenylcysteine O-methyltransferase Ste14
VQFRRHRTTVLPRETPEAMIQTGIYRWSRNPIYLADAMILAGIALRWDAASLLLVPLFMAMIQVRFINGEEAVMRQRFGATYEAYAVRVRRWL